MSNFIPNKTTKVEPSDPPWISKTIKSMLNKQHRIIKNYKRHGYSDVDKMRLDTFREERDKTIEKTKEDYMKQVG